MQLLATVAGNRYGVPIGAVQEVARTGPPSPLPGVPAGILGLVTLRGDVLPLVDTARMLALADPGDARYLVVVADGPRRAALAVSAVHDVVELPRTVEPSDAPSLAGSVLLGDALVGIIDVAAMLSAIEDAST